MQVDSKPLAVPIHTLALVAEQDLETRQKQFDTITSTHVYSLEPNTLQDNSPIAAANLLLYSEEKYIDAFEKSSRGELYGYIKNPHVKIIRDGLRPVNLKGLSNNKPAFTSSKQADAPSAAPSATTDKPSAAPSAKIGKPSASFWGKAAEAKPKQTAQPTKPEPSSKGTKRKGDESDQDEQEQDRKLAAASIDHDVEMDQAAEDQDDDDPEANARRQQEADDLEAMMMDADEDQIMAATTEAEVDPELPSKDPETTLKSGRKRVQKTRKVLKKKTSKNERGYLVTEDVWEIESYSEDEGGKDQSVPASTSGSPAIRPDKKVPTKKPSAGQANLMSFFGRNK